MVFLIVLFSITALISAVLSIKATVIVEYSDKLTVFAKWTFLKYSLMPFESAKKGEEDKKEEEPAAEPAETVEKEEKKAEEYENIEIKSETADEKAEITTEQKKEEKEEAEKTEIPAEEKKEEKKVKKTKPKAAKSGPISVYYQNKGINGFRELLGNLLWALNAMFSSIFRSIKIKKLVFKTYVHKDDAAETAIAFGKTCAEYFPLFGFICARCNVKNKEISITPLFLEDKKEMYFYAEIALSPAAVIRAAVVLAVRLLFRVLLKFILGSREKK
ncbi:MAG: DUF2953 domain-containing protein [Oscillospiraceae bacterium]|nr:DUF2953 domain-containing protein [Oscillospiraceae bacterium]